MPDTHRGDEIETGGLNLKARKPEKRREALTEISCVPAFLISLSFGFSGFLVLKLILFRS
jgi:hypothetical protein